MDAAPDTDDLDRLLDKMLLSTARGAWQAPFDQAEYAGDQLALVVHQLLHRYDAKTLARWIQTGDDAEPPVHTIRHWDRRYHATTGEPRRHTKHKASA